MQRGLLHSQPFAAAGSCSTGTPRGPADFSRTTQVHKAHRGVWESNAPSSSGQSAFSGLGFVVYHFLQTLRISELEKSSKSAGRQPDWREIVHQIPYSGSDPTLERERERTARAWQPSCGARPRTACDTQPKPLLLQRGQLSSQSGRFCALSSSS